LATSAPTFADNLLTALRKASYRPETIRAGLATVKTANDPQPFGLEWVARYLPHYLTAAPSRLHADLAADLAALAGRRGTHLNRIAPRGSAKTTFASKAYPLWCALEGTEQFILLLSDSGEQAETFLSAIKDELEANPRIARDYPHAAGVGPLWQSGRIRTRNGVQIATKGAGGRIRGLSRGHRRPTLVVIDDANEDADSYSATKRKRKWEWLTKGVLPIGEPTTNFLSVGTAIHREAIPVRLAAAGGWQTKSYRSILEWPKRMDLWYEWERLYTNIADTTRGQAARTFYEAHRSDMDAGAVVLWPERFPLYTLMEKRALGGEQAFNSEYQDTPGTEGGTEWSPEYFAGPDFWVNALPDPADCVFRVQALDPSKGRTDKPGDYQAHVCLAVDRAGILYFDADGRREDVTEMVARANQLCEVWQSRTLVIEDNGTMGLLEAEFRELDKSGRLKVPDYEVITSTDPKAFRIRLVGPYLARRQVRVVNGTGGRMLVQQWQDWPNGEHDDLPDAAAIALKRVLA